MPGYGLETGTDGLLPLEHVMTRMAQARNEQKYRWRPDASDPGNIYYALRPRVVFAWLEETFPTSATRWVFDGAGEDQGQSGE